MAIGVIISGLGVMNGWILVTGQVPMATAKDNLFPKIFKRENKKGAPAIGLIIGSALSSIVLLMNFTEGLVDQFKIIVEITVFTALIPYFFTAAAYVLLLINDKVHIHSWAKTFVLGSLGMAFSLWAIYGSGRDTVFYGWILLISGSPLYLIMRWNQKKK